MNLANLLLPGLAAYALIVNGVTYALFAFDKRRAVLGQRRIPESDLLGWAMVGGSVGAVVAQQTLRHKTRKQPFRDRLMAVIVVQILGLIALWTLAATRLWPPSGG